MGRSGRLAIGAIVAAGCAGQVAPAHLLAGVALAMAAVLLLAQLRPTGSVRALAPVAIGAGLLAVRMVATPPGPAVLDVPPDGDGPWALAVLATGSPREGQQTATLGTRPERHRRSALPPPYLATRSSFRAIESWSVA